MKNIITKNLIILMVLFLTAPSIFGQPFAPPLPEPGTATIDGDYSECNP